MTKISFVDISEAMTSLIMNLMKTLRILCIYRNIIVSIVKFILYIIGKYIVII